MLYLNQLQYPDIPYAHNLSNGGAPEGRGNVAAAGCGPCCLCMAVDHLTASQFPLQECLALSEKHGANMQLGTSLRILAPAVAASIALDYDTTDDPDRLNDWLQRGGVAIANVGGDRENYKGLFSDQGHYILVLSVSDGNVCILDPSYFPGKYESSARKGRAVVDAPFVYCSVATLCRDCDNRDPAFYLLRRPAPLTASRADIG